MIELRDIEVSYRHGGKRLTVLDKLDLTVGQGERLAIMGPSGAGKSTLLAIIAGLQTPQAGSYAFKGRRVDTLGARELAAFRGREIGFVFQNFVLLPHLTVLENMMLPVEHLPRERAQFQARARDLLDAMGVGGLAARMPSQISGGQTQRVAIGRALMRDPSLVLADEPTGNLDTESAETVLALLAALSARGVTIVTVTHSDAVARRHDRTLSMCAGALARPALTDAPA